MDHCPLNSGLRKRAVVVVREFIEMSFIPKMKEHDPLFRNLYFGIYYAGSYYDDLRIVEPTEFDLDIKLKKPFHGRLVNQGFGNWLPIPSGFARYYCSSPPRDVKLRKKFTEDQKSFFSHFLKKIFYFQSQCVIGSEKLSTKLSNITSPTLLTLGKTV